MAHSDFSSLDMSDAETVAAAPAPTGATAAEEPYGDFQARGKRLAHEVVTRLLEESSDEEEDPLHRSSEALYAPAGSRTEKSATDHAGRARSSPIGAANPFTSLRDIARSGRREEADDNLALYAHESSRYPKVASVLSRLVKLNAADGDAEDISAEKSMAALLRKAPVKMGTLTGVYLPTIQNILGVIFFLRFSWIVGIAGAGQSFVIVAICCITVRVGRHAQLNEQSAWR